MLAIKAAGGQIWVEDEQGQPCSLPMPDTTVNRQLAQSLINSICTGCDGGGYENNDFDR